MWGSPWRRKHAEVARPAGPAPITKMSSDFRWTPPFIPSACLSSKEQIGRGSPTSPYSHQPWKIIWGMGGRSADVREVIVCRQHRNYQEGAHDQADECGSTSLADEIIHCHPKCQSQRKGELVVRRKLPT